ncbi:MORN repeat-containing protein [Besnoitia besnoiti]|uniref:MORN repeat-containing protein n=1 Tax=Besnoitia besnoiti TaxID=94643 RepID=A0A2A9ML54_BESBE|nr:MORN repeat-containing protein [Besnoitia besnoiti]PFH36357.1 MORN repeat-containing protein [Besnoitia besnoiti]
MESFSDEESEVPKYTIVTESGKQRSSREFTGFGKATYRFDEEKTEEFEGHYLNGVREGKGKYWYWNGASYEGDFQLNKKNGIGQARYKEQPPHDVEEEPDEAAAAPETFSTYLGHFREGQRDASGALLYANGDMYIGGWKNGKKSGFGRYTYASDKSQLIGVWQQGRLKHGRWILPSGVYYTGTFKRNKPVGKGVWIFPRSGNQVLGEYLQKTREATEDEVERDDDKEDALPADELLEVESIEFSCRSCTALREG